MNKLKGNSFSTVGEWAIRPSHKDFAIYYEHETKPYLVCGNADYTKDFRSRTKFLTTKLTKEYRND